VNPPIHRERLVPAWWAWAIAAALVAMLAVAYGAALGAPAGWTLALMLGALTIVVLIRTSPVVELEASALRCGPAVLPRAAMDRVEVVDGAQVRILRGPGGDGRIYTALRPWSAPGAVLITLDDPQDPHPAWLISSRNPRALAAALTATMGSRNVEEEA